MPTPSHPTSPQHQPLPTNLHDALSKGIALFDQQLFHQALPFFHQAFLLQPTNVDAHLFMGHSYLHLKQPILAEIAYRSAISLQAHNDVAIIGLAHSLNAQTKYTKALSIFRQLAHQPTPPSYPDFWKYYYLSALYLNSQDDIQLSLKFLPTIPKNPFL